MTGPVSGGARRPKLPIDLGSLAGIGAQLLIGAFEPAATAERFGRVSIRC